MSFQINANETRTETLNPADLEQVAGGWCRTEPFPIWPISGPGFWPTLPIRPPTGPGSPDPVSPRFPPLETLPTPLPGGIGDDGK